ncbi:helicase HerA domain-containing protein, partial [Ligilactobacillus salivarius]|uniref:helicase HerA domain-containing protein n=1 Tax=Ligilactobacillus salivarius TaxID=1624 RepID=UPI0031F2FD11
MNFCIFCGNKLMGNEVFCPKCGKRLDNIHIEVPVKKLIQDELKDIKKSSLNEEKEFVNEKNTLKDKTKNHIVKEIQNITRDSLIEDKEMSVLTDEREIVENPQNIAIKRDNFETKNHIVEEKQSIAKDNSVKNNDISVLSDKQEKVEKLQNTTIEEKKDEFKDYIVKKGQNTVESTLNKKGSIQTSRDDKVSPFSNIKNDKPKNIDKVDNLMMDSSIKKSSDTGRLSTNTRIYLGKRLTGNKKIYWEYGNPQLPNKHMLVTGKSGQGKTYFLQTIMWELSKNKVSSLVIDYTDSYLNNELDDDFKKKMGKKLKEIIVYQEKLPINPFKIQKRFLPGLVLTETPEDMVDRIIEVLDFIFHLGIQQKSLARRIMLKGYKNNPTDYTLTQFKEQLLETNSGENVYSRMSVLLDRDPFTYQSSFDWSKVFNYEGTVTILQMVQYQ